MKKIFLLYLILVYQHNIFAQWSTTPNGNNSICTSASDQKFQQSIADGSGGIISTWQDFRAGEWNIYAQRYSANGLPLWTINGILICNASFIQYYPSIVSDGAGGAIIAWEDYRTGASTSNGNIYAQRVNASGVVQWTNNGVVICNQTNAQYKPILVSDGSAGAIIFWEDVRLGNYDIYAQRVNAVGIVQWTANGIPICTALDYQLDMKAIADGIGGAILCWEDSRNNSSTNTDIYAQKVNAIGVVQWTTNGIVLCNLSNGQNRPSIASDNLGGAFICWSDGRPATYGIYAQRVNGSGILQWTANGIALTNVQNNKGYNTICSDGNGGAIVCWEDFRVNTNGDIYAQRIQANGALQWNIAGVAVCTAVLGQNRCSIAADGLGGAVIAWKDLRMNSFYYDVYAQRIHAAGNVAWITNGIVVSTSFGEKENIQVITDAANGGIVCWDDKRSGGFDIYAQKICSAGLLGACPIPEINIIGNATSIINGDSIPSLTDHTDFGNVIIPNSITRSFSMQNTGSAVLHIDSIYITGTGANAFTVGNYTDSVNTSNTITFNILFTPTVEGIFTATIHILNDDTDESEYTFSIKGNGTCMPPDLPVISPNNINNCGVLSNTLSISTSALHSASAWHWYTDSCNGTPIGIGNSITVTPITTTTYYARGEGGCISAGVCGSMTIQVQPCSIPLQVKLFLQGYYVITDSMQPVLLNQGVLSNPSITDAIFVELHHADTPYHVVTSQSTFLQTNGIANCVFTTYLGNYYIVIKHRNTLETWSAEPVLLNSVSNNYDFSIAASKVYGNNQVAIDTNKWAFYSGDIFVDGNIDLLDWSYLENEINNFYSGYTSTDINGDGNVDLFDAIIVENNITAFAISMQP